MPRNYLNDEQKRRIIARLEEGRSLRQTAAEFNVSHTCVAKIRNRWHQNHNFNRLGGTGQWRVSTNEEDEALVEHIRQNPFSTAVEAREATNFPGHVRTARKRIKEAGLKNSAAARKPFLTDILKQRRVEFCNEYINRDANFWNSVVFSDEKVFQSSHSGRVRVYRPRNCRFEERYVQQMRNSGRFSVNVWAWISAEGQGMCFRIDERLTGPVYRNILENVMLPSVRERFPGDNFIFQQDNAPVHTARIVRDWIEENDINTLPWPARSPDLNPIENVWGYLVKKLQKRDIRPQNRDELWQTINQAWNELENYNMLNLVQSMNQRLQMVIDKNGSATKY